MFTIDDLQKLYNSSNYIVFFGGAGVSTESGIKDFRGENGLYKEKFKNYRPEDILSKSFFFNHTKDFYEYYKTHFLNPNIKPNKAHDWLAKAELKGKIKSVITQNIDGLHQMAGSKNVIELHGSVHRYYTVKKNQPIDGLPIIIKTEGIPKDTDGDIIKPDVTLYEEPLDTKVVSNAIMEINKADLLIIAGTSLTVYPAASYIQYFKGENIVVIDRMPMNFKNFLQGNVGEILSKIKI
ncbi:NAD-dependent protein deacylase [Acholeplasma granularum]|uniref:NAD-dependent protein deacylase n=1 Tax=Acholeplasma granularum TaxID=264635 RepID=UPI000470B757|nr:NAD-dependent protein deacylase [Acholeplasma granularum]